MKSSVRKKCMVGPKYRLFPCALFPPSPNEVMIIKEKYNQVCNNLISNGSHLQSHLKLINPKQYSCLYEVHKQRTKSY